MAALLFLLAANASATVVVSGSQRARVAGGDMEVQGNEWNSKAPLTVSSDGGPDWHITSSQINQSTVGAYPGLFVGLHGSFKSANDPFPLKLSSIAPGKVATDVVSHIPASAERGKWVDFYDVFLEPNPTANPFFSTPRGA